MMNCVLCIYVYMYVYAHTTKDETLKHFSCHSVRCFTCSSYGIKAMLISFSVFMCLATSEWDNSLNNSSGHAVKKYTEYVESREIQRFAPLIIFLETIICLSYEFKRDWSHLQIGRFAVKINKLCFTWWLSKNNFN